MIAQGNTNDENRKGLLSVLWAVLCSHSLLIVLLMHDQALAATKSDEFTIPIRFEVIGNGVEAPPQELQYDVSTQKALVMGPIELSPKTFFAKVSPVSQLDLKFQQALLPSERSDLYLVLQWPEALIPEGNLEFISRSGRVVQKFDIDAKNKVTWKLKLDEWRKILIEKGLAANSLIFSIPWAMKISADDIEQIHEPFKICINRPQEEGMSRICSMTYEVRNSKKFGLSFSIFPVTAAPARVIALNESAKLQDSIVVSEDQTVQFFAELESGISYEFVSRPAKINLMELTADPDKESALIVGWGDKPAQATTDLNTVKENFFTKYLGETIGDLRKFWKTKMSLKKSEIYFPGESGGLFRQKFIVTKLPREEIRPYLHRRTIDSTYINGAELSGQKRKEVDIRSKQIGVSIEKNRIDFEWEFQAKKRGEFNKSYILVKDGDQEFKAFYELYKGYPRELSTRLSGIISSEGKTVLVGEIAFNYWFEDILGWNQYYLARQRWGLSAKAFQSLSAFAISSQKNIVNVGTVDLKYRFTPGLWNRDESWGGMLSFQRFKYGEFDSTFYGGGVFWARSMPRAFDDALNLLWLMRYPKWVDAEFIYYPVSGERKTTVTGPTYALNFHGKVIWTNRIFGEAGFGIKQYGFNHAGTINQKITFASIYGTAGIGINF